MRAKLLVVALVIAVAAPLLAQSDYPRATVFGGYSYLSLDTSSASMGRNGLNGWNGQVTANFNRWLGLTADFGGYYGDISGASVHDYSYLFGPTLTYHAEHVAPFLHALFGGNHVNVKGTGISTSDNAFAYAIGGGLDVPFKSFGFRVAQVDWLRTNHVNRGQNNVRVSTGVTFNFGK